MAVYYQQEKQMFTLQTAHTTYQMKVDGFGFLCIYIMEGKLQVMWIIFSRIMTGDFQATLRMRGKTGRIPWMFCRRNIRESAPGITGAVR